MRQPETAYYARPEAATGRLLSIAEGAVSRRLQAVPEDLPLYDKARHLAWLQGDPRRAHGYIACRERMQARLAEQRQLDRLGLTFVLSSRCREPNGIGIGHLGLLDYYIKAMTLGLRPARRTVMLSADQTVANRCYREYWADYIGIVSDEESIDTLWPLLPALETRIDSVAAAGRLRGSWWEVMAEVEAEWQRAGRPPLLRLRPTDRERGRAALRSAGVGESDWFVALHVRTGSFKGEPGNPNDADISTYREAIRAVTGRGGWVIRMGDPGMPALPPQDRLIDYAHSALRSDWMDVFLCAACRFYIGTASGLHLVPHSFGVPCVLTNVTPQLARPFSNVTSSSRSCTAVAACGTGCCASGRRGRRHSAAHSTA